MCACSPSLLLTAAAFRDDAWLCFFSSQNLRQYALFWEEIVLSHINNYVILGLQLLVNLIDDIDGINSGYGKLLNVREPLQADDL